MTGPAAWGAVRHRARTVRQRVGFRVWHHAAGPIGRLAILGWPHCIGLNFRNRFCRPARLSAFVRCVDWCGPSIRIDGYGRSGPEVSLRLVRGILQIHFKHGSLHPSLGSSRLPLAGSAHVNTLGSIEPWHEQPLAFWLARPSMCRRDRSGSPLHRMFLPDPNAITTS